MNKNSIVIGLGIGHLYKQVLTELGQNVITVDLDPSKEADFTSVESAIAAYDGFDTAHLCTPNFTHAGLAKQLAPHSKIVFVEKPGVKNSAEWEQLVNTFPDTRFCMVKNNQWRDNIDELRELAQNSKIVALNWINEDRVPNPGTWFTTKELAYGGVSRDLMPHLLSLFMTLEDYKRADSSNVVARRIWELSDLHKTDYGIVKKDGTYDVDDYCYIDYTVGERTWRLTADWRSNKEDKRNIVFYLNNGNTEVFELGLCPENAYKNMIYDCMENIANDKFWLDQLDQDCYIHERIQDIEV